MATVVNNPAPASDSGSGVSLIVGLVFVMAMLILLFVYGIPAFRQSTGSQINVPDKVDVNINQPK